MTAEQYAIKLRDAYANRAPISPLRETIGIEDIELAYKIQDVNTQHRLDNGERIVGKKIGLTSKSVQAQFGIEQPDYGMLFDTMEVLNGLSISVSELLQPKVETEIAFVLSEDLDIEGITIVDLISCIDYALPAIEIVGSRIQNWDISITDTIADNASASHFVIGHTPKTLDEFDVIACKMKLHKNGELVSEGTGASCLGSPLNSMLWLANKMMEVNQPLQAGELIFTGSLGPMVPVIAGDHIETEINGLGHVSVLFDK